MYSMVSFHRLNTPGLSVVFVPAGGIAPPFKHPLGAGYLLRIKLTRTLGEVIAGCRIEEIESHEAIE